MVWFLSVVTEEFVSAARQGTAWSKFYSYSYGWSLMSAAASAGASFLAALCIGHAHMTQYTPWNRDKLIAVHGGEHGGSRPMMMKCKSESHIGGGGRSFTSDTIRTYLTNDSRRLQQSQSSSQGCFVGTASSQSFNDSSSLVDLTKPVSSDTVNEQDSQETTIEMVAPPPHCSRHLPSSKSSQFRNMRTQSLSQSPEYMNTEEFQVNASNSPAREASTLSRNVAKRVIRQSSLQVPPQGGDSSSSTSNDAENGDVGQRPDTQVHASPRRCGSESFPSPPLISSITMEGSSSSSPSSYSSKTLPRRIFSDLPRLPEQNSFSNDSYNRQTDQDSDMVEQNSFTEVEPPDLFNTNKKAEDVSYCNTLPYPGKRVTVYSKKGNVRAATIADDEVHHLTHV